MTRDEAVAAILVEIPGATPADVEGFLAATGEEQALIVKSYRDAGTMPSASSWDRVLAVIKGCAELAGLFIPILGAVQGAYGLLK